jgi:hypothetical protein
MWLVMILSWLSPLLRCGENRRDSIHAEPHYSYILPLPNCLLNLLFSRTRLKRKDFQEITRLAWTQEVPSSNLGAPTNLCFLFPMT